MQLEVKINLILHATEDENKVVEQLENIFQIILTQRPLGKLTFR